MGNILGSKNNSSEPQPQQVNYDFKNNISQNSYANNVDDLAPSE